MNNGTFILSDDGKTLLGVTDKSITEAVIPDGVTMIGDGAFACCTIIQNIDIPEGVTHIGDEAFYFCKALQSINIPNSVTYIGNSAFEMCTVLKSIHIPNSVICIGHGAFACCRALRSVKIPNSVLGIGNLVFESCSALKKIDVEKDNPHFISIDGVLFTKDLTHIFCFPQAKKVKYYDIPNSVTYIMHSAFLGCKTLQNIYIPNSVTEIGNSAFLGCKTLQNIYIPNSVTEIGNSAFSICLKLKSIHIRITDIDSCCINENAFYGINFDNCILYVPSGTLWAYRHHPVFSKFKNIEIERITKEYPSQIPS